jgi:hypothetical protein
MIVDAFDSGNLDRRDCACRLPGDWQDEAQIALALDERTARAVSRRCYHTSFVGLPCVPAADLPDLLAMLDREERGAER